VTSIPSPKNWNSSSSFARKMDTGINRYDVPWNWQHGLPKTTINPPQLHSYRTPKQHTADSAEFWKKHNTKSITLPPRKVFSYLPTVKDASGLRTPGIYSIPCECGTFYIGQSGDPTKSELKSTADI
jgi:hypothetical protein